MSPGGAIVVVVVVIGGVIFGWHGQKASAANSDVKVAKNRLRGGRQTRMRSGAFLVAIAAIAVFVIIDMVR